MSRIALATTTGLLLMLGAPALRAQVLAPALAASTALALAAQDDLPDGDLDFSADDLDALDDKKPADKKPADKKPGDKKPGDKKPGDKKPGDKKPGDEDVVSPVEPGPIPGDDEVVAPPDERPGEEDKPADETAPTGTSAWSDDDLGSNGERPPVVHEDPEEEERARGRVGTADEEDGALTSNPLFWAGVGGGALLVAGAAVGGGFLVYYLVNMNNGTVRVTFQ
ncbi:MAG: hypothetical protein JXR83_17070 [Deltaproteobacteria bacterium]|nr:hypothetical protein [Deltaproteobacteria bacterium]